MSFTESILLVNVKYYRTTDTSAVATSAIDSTPTTVLLVEVFAAMNTN